MGFYHFPAPYYGFQTVDIVGEHWREMLALTYGMITHVDAEIGRVLEALELAGKADNTIIIFTGDHDDMLGHLGNPAELTTASPTRCWLPYWWN